MLISVDIHSHFKLKYLSWVDGSEVRALADYLSSDPSLQAGWLTVVCNSSHRRSNIFFWPLRALYPHLYKLAHSTIMYT